MFPSFDTESDRLAAVTSLGLGAASSDPTLDHAVAVAAQLFSAPIALVSLVEDTRQIFAAKRGLELCSTDRDVSFCAHAVTGRSLLVVRDAAADPRFARNPLVTGAPGVRFYAGAPLITRDGHAVGALCVIDTKARSGFNTREENLLSGLADLVISHLERQKLSASQRALHRLASATSDALITANQAGDITFWNTAAEKIFGYTAAEVVGAPLELIVPEHLRKAHRVAFKRVAGGGPAKLSGVLELQGRRRNGEVFPLEMSLAHWTEESGVQFASVLRDVTERRREQEEIHQLTTIDVLTGLPNRVAFLTALDALTKVNSPFSVLQIGLDRFKAVNASAGLGAGDAVLRAAGQRIALAAESEALTARLGSDEFGVLLLGSDDPLQATVLAERIIAALAEPFAPREGDFRLSASVGAVLSPGIARAASAHEALKQALLALQDAKQAGGGRCSIFSVKMTRQVRERQQLDDALHRAVEAKELELHYQPQVRLADGAIVGAEALLRWRHPERGLLTPAAFLIHLEKSDLSLRVGRWILEEACSFGAVMQEAGTPVRIGVNLFSGHLRSATLELDVVSSLETTGLNPQLLELEITETTVIGAEKSVPRRLRSMRQRGVSVAFDDYGTGYASLSLLKSYPVSRLKIDRQFVTHLGRDRADASIIRAVLALGDSLGLEVIAEGVETSDQASALSSMGCVEAQGHLFGKAVRPDEFRKLSQLTGSPVHSQGRVFARDRSKDRTQGFGEASALRTFPSTTRPLTREAEPLSPRTEPELRSSTGRTAA